MKILKCLLLIGMVVISTQCTYNQINQIPTIPQSVKTDLGTPFPFEAALLISDQTRDQIFRSQTIPDNIMGYFVDPLEPYQIPVGKDFETASVQIFSKMFKKIHLVRSMEEGTKYPLIIEPKLLNFDFHLSYLTLFLGRELQVSIIARSQAKVDCTLKTSNRAIWQGSVQLPATYQTWFDEYHLKEIVGRQASETLMQSLEELAVKMAEESRKPQAVSGWLERVHEK